MFQELGFNTQTVERAAFLIRYHHTYNAINGRDYQTLVKTDFPINL